MFDPASLIRQYLLFFILPLWIAAGLADYMLHRRTHIEVTSGTKESLLHALQLAEAGIPVLMALLLDINALVLLMMLVALLAHEATALWDVHVAIHRRYVGVLEQHVHSFLELLPLMGVSFVTILYWDQFLALFGMGSEPARFEFLPKSNPLPFAYLVGSFSAVGLLIILPYGEELWRCIAAGRHRRGQGVMKQAA
jgi:hypothetical protein